MKICQALAPTIRAASFNSAGILRKNCRWNQWDEIVLDGLASMVDYRNIHLYSGHSKYYVNVFQPHQAERAVRICDRSIERVRYTQRIPHPIHIAFDEWNVWYRTRSDEDRVAGIEERYDLADALAVATYLVVNRDKDRGHTATIQFAGGRAPSSAAVAEVNGPNPQAVNSFEHPDVVGVRERQVAVNGSGCAYAFPAHSITLLRLGFA